LFKKKDAGESFIKLLEEVKSHESSLKEIFITSKELEEKSKKSIEEKKKIEDKISDVLQSQEYQEDKKIKQDKTLEKEIIEREIQRARENMPWKELLNVYHHNEKKREFIKNYRKGFTKSLEEDKELQMNVLLQEMNCANNINFKELQMKISKMYVPIILPTAMLAWSDTAALMLTANSGELVPNATTVRPITNGVIPKAVARRDAPLTTASAPRISSASPAINKRLTISLDRYI